jgi:predicted DNA-binding protein YlxM (UPF0122 family)
MSLLKKNQKIKSKVYANTDKFRKLVFNKQKREELYNDLDEHYEETEEEKEILKEMTERRRE